MEPPLQSSFIPKKTAAGSHHMSGGIISFLANLLFIIALIASVGVFVYTKYLSGRIAKMETNLSAAREALQPDLIRELSRSDRRLKAANELIDQHVTLSTFFEFLQSATLKSVRFTGFSFSTGEGGALVVSMKGEARTYATVALQSSIFNEDPNFIKPQFSDLDLNEQGNVVFSFQSEIHPSVISYADHFTGTVTAPVAPEAEAPDPIEIETSPASTSPSTTPTPAVNQNN